MGGTQETASEDDRKYFKTTMAKNRGLDYDLFSFIKDFSEQIANNRDLFVIHVGSPLQEFDAFSWFDESFSL